ncbi:MAG: alpha/beta hydrolase [Deltaproteobacteria bacterium]|nr:alpha/beta hydrolase [Deltaproteobacteria bacterium]
MPEINVRGRLLAYGVEPSSFDRSSLATVFIHGTGGDRDDWKYQLSGLSPIATMIALELPGHGASSGPGEASVPEFAKWVVEFVEALGLEKVVLVGCSLGSAITQTIALAAPPWLKGIGLVGSGARLRVHPMFLDGLRSAENLGALKVLAEFCLSPAAGESVIEALREKMAGLSAEQVYNDLFACNEFDVMDRVKHIALPAWILVGEDDKLTPVKYSQYLHKEIPGSTLVIVPEAGHLAMAEKPELFNSSFEQFLYDSNLINKS